MRTTLNGVLKAAGIAAALAVGTSTPASASVCAAVSSGLNFGLYNPLAGTQATTIGSVHVLCMQVVGKVTVTVDLTPGYSQSYAARFMYPEPDGVAPKSILKYNVYFNGTAQIFGNGTGGTAHYVRTLVANRYGQASDVFSITAIAPARQDVALGFYDDDQILLQASSAP